MEYLIVAIVAVIIAAFIMQGRKKVPPEPAPVFVDPPATRDEILFGYYGDSPTQIAETKDHVNVAMVAGWGNNIPWADEVIGRVAEASILHLKSMIMMPFGTYTNGQFSMAAFDALTLVFDRLQQLGYLANVVAIYPVDEPELYNISNEEVVAGNKKIRDLMAKYPELKYTALAVIYSNSPNNPGIETYDWVGIDDYSKGASVLASQYTSLVGRLTPEQRTIIIPGGADPWKQDPDAFVNYALNTPQVKLVMPFIWIDNAATGVGLGIRSNGMMTAYIAAANKLK